MHYIAARWCRTEKLRDNGRFHVLVHFGERLILSFIIGARSRVCTRFITLITVTRGSQSFSTGLVAQSQLPNGYRVWALHFHPLQSRAIFLWLRCTIIIHHLPLSIFFFLYVSSFCMLTRSLQSATTLYISWPHLWCFFAIKSHKTWSKPLFFPRIAASAVELVL